MVYGGFDALRMYFRYVEGDPRTDHITGKRIDVFGVKTTDGAGTYTVTGPASANVAPKGYYLLFAVNAAGDPFIATWVQAGSGGSTDRAARLRR